ncbi:MAG: SusC/RagA family TonB-linked outer membrane protein [Mediterranea sp.]|jgi:TonB-linked SusC/RagA family outer membrane protein|nr:SusC/RagA family TonB-linked outer membrane protein [Mediterranea sp.]
MENSLFHRRPDICRALLILFFITLPLQWAAAQLSLTTSRTELETVIKQIQTQSGYRFFYSDALSGVAVEATAVKDASMEALLAAVLKGTGISFRIENRIVYLSKQEAQAPAVRPDSERTITGAVTDSKGDPLAGVSILAKGTSNGTITDVDGNYTIVVSGATPLLVFSYIGYKTEEISPEGLTTVNVVLQEDALVIEEVVVTALGIKRAQKALSYNVQQVSEDELLRNRDANLINALSGKVAGVTINSSSSGVGGASKVVMRGSKSIAQSSNALYVIDGAPMHNFGGEGGTEHGSSGTTEAIADLNPEDIESMSVLTGAAAAALYGSDAANGAIIITTKKGKAGHTGLTVSQTTEFLRPLVMPRFQNRYGTGSSLAANETEKSWGRLLNASNAMGYSPAKNYLETGMVMTENISFSTGTERNRTYLSAAVLNSLGMVPNNNYNRYNFTFRNTTSFLDDRMTLDIGAGYIKQDDCNMTNQGTYSNPLVTAYLFPRGDDFADIRMFERYDSQRRIHTQYWPQRINEFTGQNPYWINYRNLRVNKKDRYMMNAGLSFDLLDWLSIAGRIRIDNSANRYTEKLYASSNTTLTEGSGNGFYGTAKTEDKQLYGDIILSINRLFLDDRLSLQANAGTSVSDLRQDMLESRGPIQENGIPNLFNVFQLDNTKTKRAQSGWHDQTQSVFASMEWGWKSAYYLTLTGRSDWPSQLAGTKSKNSFFFYPSAGASFILSEIFALPRAISYLKLRASYASVGLPFARFLANPTYSWNYSTQSWETKSNYPMYNLKPEKTTSWEAGLTMRFLGHFNLDASFYTAKTYNQTFDPKISVSSGYSTLYVQTGSVRNHGAELSLGYKNEWPGGFGWQSNVTFGANRNKIIELVDNYVHPETGESITKERLDIGGFGQARFVLKKGGSLGDLYSQADLQRDSNGKIYVDANGNISINNNAGDIKLGSVFPKANTAWRNDFSYKGFTLGFMISARLGGIVYSATQAALDLYGVSETSAAARDNGWVDVNGDRMNAEKWYKAIGANNGVPQYYTYSATNIRLQEVGIGYTFPRSRVRGIADITVSLTGRNLWMIYCKAPFDPESTATTGNYYQGIDNFMTPNTRNAGFNVRLNF